MIKIVYPEYQILKQRKGYEYLVNRQVVIDPTLLMRKMTAQCVSELMKLGDKVRWKVIDGFHSQASSILKSIELQSIFTDTTVLGFIKGHERLSTLKLEQCGNFSSSYNLFLSLSGEKIFATGNETEAIRHILSKQKGHLLLVTDQEMLLIRDRRFPAFRAQYCVMEQYDPIKIPDYAEATQLYDLNKRTYPLENILSSSGAEGPVLTSGDQLIKCYYGSTTVDRQLPRKLQALSELHRLLELQGLETQFAFPRKLLYLKSGSGFVGFLMDRMEFVGAPDDILCKYRTKPYDRWQMAINLTSQVLFLHLRDIQPVDYNWNNFGVRKDLHMVFMDTDSYVVGTCGTKGHSPKTIPFQADFSEKADLITLEYLYLHAAIFFILTNCRWPFTPAEKGKPSQYILNPGVKLKSGTEQLHQDLPLPLRHYFQDVLGKQQIRDPFELYHLLMRLRSYYEHGTAPDLKLYQDVTAPAQRPISQTPVRKRGLFHRLHKKDLDDDE